MNRTQRCLLALLLMLPLSAAHAAGQLYLSPGSAQAQVGKPFTVEVLANAGQNTVSAVEGDLSYDPGALSVDNLSIDSSALHTWATTPSYDSASGKIQFSGWAQQSISGDGNVILSITFVPLRAGQAEVQFISGAMLDATNPSSDILASMQAGAYSVEPAQSAPPPVPQASTTPLVPPAAPTLSPVAALQEGDAIALKGSAQSNTTVQLFIQKDGEAPQESDVLSAADGSFAYVGSAAQAGSYTIWALAENPAGESSSTPRQELTVTSQAAALALSGVSDALIILLPLLALLSLIAFCIAYVIHRRSRSHF